MARGEEFEKFKKSALSKANTLCQLSPRRLKPDDLKILDELRTPVAPFARATADTSQPEPRPHPYDREVLKALLYSGFCFSFSEDEWNLKQMGREILVKACLWSVNARQFDILLELFEWLKQTKLERPERTGELQKIIDGVLRAENSMIFDSVLKSPEAIEPIHSILQMVPESSVRLAIMLSGQHNWILEKFGGSIIRQLSTIFSWLKSEVEKNPSHPAWEKLVVYLAAEAPHWVPRMLEIMVGSGERAGAIRIVKQLSGMGSEHPMPLIQNKLRSSRESERLEAYSWILEAHAKDALPELKNIIEKSDFSTRSLAEKESFFAAFLTVVDGDAFAWVENIWSRSNSGIFKKRPEIETRMALVKVLQSLKPILFKRLLERVPLNSMTSEIRDLIAKFERMGAKA